MSGLRWEDTSAPTPGRPADELGEWMMRAVLAGATRGNLVGKLTEVGWERQRALEIVESFVNQMGQMGASLETQVLGQPRLPFHWFAAAVLAKALPFRRKGLLVGSKVCEPAAVAPMAEAAFFVGAALSLGYRPGAEDIWETALPPDTREAAARDYATRTEHLGVTTPKYWALFHEHVGALESSPTPLEWRECAEVIGKNVLLGLGFGLAKPEIAHPMLDAWAEQEAGWQRLSVGGLDVRAAPRVTSAAQAIEMAKSVYVAWTNAAPIQG